MGDESFVGSSVSDMAWVGIALAQLFARTGRPRYLEGSLRLARWIVDNALDTVGLGGYSFGVDGNNQRLSSTKLTEHNIDVYGFFTNLLAPITGDATWADRGRHALDFVERLWNPDGGYFYTGSKDGRTIDTTPVLEEVQSEGYCFQVDLAWRTMRRGFTVVEVPITFVERTEGASKMTRRIVAEALWRVTGWGIAARVHRHRVPAPPVAAEGDAPS